MAHKALYIFYKRYPGLWVGVIIAIFAISIRIYSGARTIDDSYITFRYARNILAGEGFVYNPGEHVLGTTTPLYALLMVSLGSISGGVQAPFPILALLTNAIADGIACILLFILGSKIGSQRVGIATALVWSIAPYSVTFAIGGLETSVFVLLILAMAWAHSSGRHNQGAFFASLALLTRPDVLILLGPFILNRLVQIVFRVQKSIRREILIFLIPVSIWIIFATFFFGSPLPHSMIAKSLAYRLPQEAAFVRLLQHYATPFFETLTFGIPAIGIGLVAYPFLAIIGIRQAIIKHRDIWPFLIYPWLYFIVYSVANPLIFRWYLTPPLPFYFLSIMVGIDHLISQGISRLDYQPSKPARIQNIAAILLSGLMILAPFYLSLQEWDASPDHGLKTAAPKMAWYELELLYRQAADRVQQEITDNTELPILAAGDVGVLGYFTQTKILDTVGLNSKITTSYYPLDEKFYVTNYALPPDLIMDLSPDFVVILEVYGRLGLLRDERFSRNYNLLLKIPTDIYGSDGLLIYKKSLP